MNATVQAIIARLPRKLLLTPGDIAGACGFETSSAVLAAIRLGKIPAVKIGSRYILGREAVVQWLEENEFIPDEGEIR